MDRFGRRGRAAISQSLEAAQVIRLCFGHLRQQVQHCRHEHRVSYAFALDQLTETLRAELWNRDLARTESRCCEHGGENGNVEKRGPWQRNTRLSGSQSTPEMVEVGQDVALSQH